VVIIVIALLEGSLYLALIGGNYGLQFRLHRSYNLLNGFLDLFCELQELLSFTHDGLSIIKKPRM
jgi:hypothetical protein